MLFRRLLEGYPDLDYFDADIPVQLRHAVAYDLFPLARCRIVAAASVPIPRFVGLKVSASGTLTY